MLKKILYSNLWHLPAKKYKNFKPVFATKRHAAKKLKIFTKKHKVKNSYTFTLKLGRRQVVRHRVLIPTFRGSNPLGPDL